MSDVLPFLLSGVFCGGVLLGIFIGALCAMSDRAQEAEVEECREYARVLRFDQRARARR